MNIVKFRFKPEKPQGGNADSDSLAEAIVCCLIMYLYQYNLRPLAERRAQKRQTATHTRRIHSEPAGLRQKRSIGRQTIYDHKRKLERTKQWLRANGGGNGDASALNINSNNNSSNIKSNSSNSSNNNSCTSGGNATPPDSKFSIQLRFSEATVDRNRD